jgi:hypothetical protein
MFQKIILSALLLWSFQPAPKSIYDFVIPGMDGEKIQAATKGKKLLVIIVSANTQNISRLKMIDSLQGKEPGRFKALAMPVLYLEQPGALGDFRKLMNQVKPGFAVSRPVSSVNNDEDQNKLLQWLTHKDQNLHFEQNVQDGQMFLVNEFGVLFATMGANTPPHAIKKLLDIQTKF